MRALSKDEDSFEVPITPLIDVVFLLLIFFLAATTFISEENDSAVDLPTVTGSSNVAVRAENLTINIRQDGTIIINGRIATQKNLVRKVRQWKVQNNVGKLLVRADNGVDYGRVMQVIGKCKKAGFNNIGLPVVAGVKIED